MFLLFSAGEFLPGKHKKGERERKPKKTKHHHSFRSLRDSTAPSTSKLCTAIKSRGGNL